MSRIWWQYTDWNSDNIAVWPPDQLPNYCTIFRSAWINQWLGWKYYIHGHYPPSFASPSTPTYTSAFAYPYRVAREYNFPDSPGINSANGFGVWLPADYAEWNRRVANGKKYKNSFVLEHTLGKQYLPTGMDGEGNVQLGMEDHRFAWWNPSGIPNITGVNHGTLREYVDNGCLGDTSGGPVYFNYLDRLNFWLQLPALYRDTQNAQSHPSTMKGLPVLNGETITIPAADGGAWGTFDDHDFVLGEFDAPWKEDSPGVVSSDLPAVPQMDVYTYGKLYPNAYWDLQEHEAGSLRLWLLLMRNRLDAAGAFGQVFQGHISWRGWDYSASRWEERIGIPPRVSPFHGVAYHGWWDAGWHIQTEFIDPSYSGDDGDNTWKNVIGGQDPNFNYAIVSSLAESYPDGGSPSEIPTEKWYCHEIIDCSLPGITLDSRLSAPIGATEFKGAGNIDTGTTTGGFWYFRNVFAVQYPRKKLPPDFRSFDQPLGVNAPEIWGTGE